MDGFDLNALMRPKRICLCRLVEERQLVSAIRDGCHTLEQLIERTDCTTGCGTCLGQVMEILNRELKAMEKEGRIQ